MDHININHECGRHDWLKAFYFDFLQCAIDPRKQENIEKGRKTLWANIGAHQFHLPEGKPDAQVLDGVITLSYPDLKALKRRSDEDAQLLETLEGSLFSVEEKSGHLEVVDPWGTRFRLEESLSTKDARGTQAGASSEGLCIRDLTLHVPVGTNLDGIARFYTHVLSAPATVTTTSSGSSVVVDVGPGQTLTFLEHSEVQIDKHGCCISHVDLRTEDSGTDDESSQVALFQSNYGPHISMYVQDIRQTYRRAQDLGVTYVNPRFKRRAYNEEEAVDDCMFRCIDIIDPDHVSSGPIVKLEHEIRSVVKRDGSKYKSCPFDEIPQGCIV